MNEGAFRTADGVAVPAVTAEEMREIDRLAVEEFGIDLLQMMENAGRNLAAHVRALARDGESSALVLAGNGGNGGGGLACARHLANRGVSVSVVLDRSPSELDGAAARQHGTLAAMGVPVTAGPDGLAAGDVSERVRDHAVIVDALVGYGLGGPLRGTVADLVGALDAARTPVVSLDVPSGLDATTGARPGPAVEPDRVVTLALPKPGLAGVDADLILADIALPEALYDRFGVAYEPPFTDEYWVAIEPADAG